MNYPKPSVTDIANALHGLNGYQLITNGESWSILNKHDESIWTSAGTSQENSLVNMIAVALNQVTKQIENA